MSDGTKIAIAIKIGNTWYSIPYDAGFQAELVDTLGSTCYEVTIDEWARLMSEYAPAIEFMDTKVRQATQQSKNKKLRSANKPSCLLLKNGLVTSI